MGIDGDRKMSKSLDNAIFLFEDEKTIHKKVYQMFTDPDHIRITDPGKIEGNVVFQFLDVFHTNKAELEDLKAHYQRGGLGDVFLKKMLTKDLNEVLEPIRIKRSSFSDEDLKNILNDGTKFIQGIAKSNMGKIKDIIFQ